MACTIPWPCFINKTLSTDELDEIAKNNKVTKPFYVGTFAADQFPKNVNVLENTCWIWNTDKIDKPGQHWVAVFISRERAFFFDSYAKTVRYYKRTFWKHFIKKKLKCEFNYANDWQLQQKTSTTCGAWCLLWLYYQCWNKTEGTPKRFFHLPFLMRQVSNDNPLREASLLENEKKLRKLLFQFYTKLKETYLTKCKNERKRNQICCSMLNFNK